MQPPKIMHNDYSDVEFLKKKIEDVTRIQSELREEKDSLHQRLIKIEQKLEKEKIFTSSKNYSNSPDLTPSSLNTKQKS